MSKSAITYAPDGAQRFSCTLTSPRGRELLAVGTVDDLEPQVEGDERLAANRAVRLNLWAYGKHEKGYRKARAVPLRELHRKQADAHRKVALEIAELVDLLGEQSRTGWCSGCLERAEHTELRQRFGNVPAYLCRACGSPSLGCAAPRCEHMATRGFGAIRIPRYCAEHRHDLPSFANAERRIPTLADYPQVLEFQARNLARGSRMAIFAATAAGVVGTAGLAAAPAIGGAVGTMVGGYSGAAATSYGLALLGGGSVAAGGFGMAGGALVVAAVGTTLGGALGASITTAYIGEDKSFRLERVGADMGTGLAVVVADGFLSEGKDTWPRWEKMVRTRYPDATVYRLHWGSKELRDLSSLIGQGGGKGAATFALKQKAKRAGTVAAKKIGPVGAVVLAADLLKNPWFVANSRAERTGVALAGLLARVEQERFVLVGHSLGARVMVSAARTMGTKPGVPRLEALHLLGAAVGVKGDWHSVNEAVTAAAYNYHSANDKVLSVFYTAAQAGSTATGAAGIRSKLPRIVDKNVTRTVPGHFEYLGNVTFA